MVRYIFQSTHPVRGATNLPKTCNAWFLISIHAPREGCDVIVGADFQTSFEISIHAPREGCDLGSSPRTYATS